MLGISRCIALTCFESSCGTPRRLHRTFRSPQNPSVDADATRRSCQLSLFLPPLPSYVASHLAHLVLVLKLAESSSEHEDLLLGLCVLLELAGLQRGLSRLCVLTSSLGAALLRKVAVENDLLVVLQRSINQILHLVGEFRRRMIGGRDDVAPFEVVVCTGGESRQERIDSALRRSASRKGCGRSVRRSLPRTSTIATSRCSGLAACLRTCSARVSRSTYL